MSEIEKLKTIQDFAGATGKVLKKAFSRRAPGIAEQFTALGKPMGARAARKMTEESSDVKRRNILENACLLLGACFLESPKTFEIVWMYLVSYVAVLQGKARVFRNFDEAYADLRYRFAAIDRAYFRGDRKEVERGLIYVDHSLKGVFAHLQLID